MSAHRRQVLAGVGLPVGCLLGVGAVWALTSSPDPVTTHWNWSGEPDGSMSLTSVGVATAVLLVVTGVLVWVASRRVPIVRGDLVGLVALATFLQWVSAGVAIAVLVANDGAEQWTDARSLRAPVALLAPIVAALVAAGAGRLVADIGPQQPGHGSRPTVHRAPDEALVWFGDVRARWPMVLGAGLVAIATVSVFAAGVVLGLVLLLAGVAVASLSSVRVTADRAGLAVADGPFGWSRTSIELGRIEHAEVIEVRPMSHGGWGYRGSLRVFRSAAVVVRAGKGIRVGLDDGRRFVVTVDDAEAGAGTINDLLTLDELPAR